MTWSGLLPVVPFSGAARIKVVSEQGPGLFDESDTIAVT